MTTLQQGKVQRRLLIAIGSRVEGGEASAGVSIAVTLLISLIPSMMNAVIYAYVWTATQSLAVSSVYHSAYDEIRDAIEKSIGFGPLVSVWGMLGTMVIGAILLWKGNWKPLVAEKYGVGVDVRTPDDTKTQNRSRAF